MANIEQKFRNAVKNNQFVDTESMLSQYPDEIIETTDREAFVAIIKAQNSSDNSDYSYAVDLMKSLFLHKPDYSYAPMIEKEFHKAVANQEYTLAQILLQCPQEDDINSEAKQETYVNAWQNEQY